MRQSELGEYECSGEQCPSCGKMCETRQGLGKHHLAVHGETIIEYEKTGIECPRGCGEYQNLAVHWGWKHNDEPFPDDTPRITDEYSRNMSAAKSGENGTWYGVSGEDHPASNCRFSHTAESKRKISASNSGEKNGMYGKTHTDAAIQKISEAATGRPMSDETIKKLSASHSGKTIAPETRKKISETLSGNSPSEETRQRISESLTGRIQPADEVEKRINALQNGVCNIQTRHTVQNNWEREIDLLLYDFDHEAEYEPEVFEIGSGTKYVPDFKVGDNIIEVKGKVWGGDFQRSARFMHDHPEYRYIVVGSELPADVWLPWKRRADLCGLLDT
jgi:hypothetical protein